MCTGWARLEAFHVTGPIIRMGQMENRNFLLEGLKGRYHTEFLGIDGRIILKWI
jgi:hypothetical protein